MENNRISIDDLVKQRFADREEEMPAGAWSRMEGLLDQQMPVVPVRRFGGWRRGGLFLLLASLAAAGGYAGLHNGPFQPFSSQNSGPAMPVANTGEVIPKLGETAIENISENAVETINAVAEPAGKELKGQSSGETPGTLAHTAVPVKAIATRFSQTPTPNNLKIPSSVPAANAHSGEASKAKPDRLLIAKNAVETAVSTPELTTGKLPERVAITRETIAPLSLRQRDFGIKTPPPKPQSIFDISRLMDLQQNLRENYVASLNAVAEMTGTSLPAAPLTLPSGGAVKPVSAFAPAGSPVIEIVVTPSDKGISTATDNTRNTTTLTADTTAAVTPPEDAIAAVRMATGVLAGINSSMGGAGALQGIHLGLYQLFHLNKKWSLGTELRYFMRINNSVDLKDDYYHSRAASETVIMRNGAPYNAVRYDTDSMLSRYRFASYQSIELPVYVQYHYNQLNYYGGLNMGYHFRPNVNATLTSIATISRFDTLAVGAPLSIPPSRDAEVQMRDFDSRLSLGFLAGVQYQMTPALHLDLRLAQVLWDNRQQQSGGAKRVSETYLKIPSLQFSVGCRIKGKKASPTK